MVHVHYSQNLPFSRIRRTKPSNRCTPRNKDRSVWPTSSDKMEGTLNVYKEFTWADFTRESGRGFVHACLNNSLSCVFVFYPILLSK